MSSSPITASKILVADKHPAKVSKAAKVRYHFHRDSLYLRGRPRSRKSPGDLLSRELGLNYEVFHRHTSSVIYWYRSRRRDADGSLSAVPLILAVPALWRASRRPAHALPPFAFLSYLVCNNQIWSWARFLFRDNCRPDFLVTVWLSGVWQGVNNCVVLFFEVLARKVPYLTLLIEKDCVIQVVPFIRTATSSVIDGRWL